MRESIKKQLLFNLLKEVSKKYAEVLEHNEKIMEILSYKATHDSLTGLYNRSYFIEELERTLNDKKNKEYYNGVLFIDIDNFKLINDTAGHRAGDELIRIVARALESIIEDDAILARFGGDEFVILYKHLSKDYNEARDKLEEIAKRILHSIKYNHIFNKRIYFITCSIGLYIFSDHTVDIMDILKYSDSAMYEAKRLGKNQFAFFDPKMEEKLKKELYMQTSLKKAIENREFKIILQPQVDTDGNIIGAEALLRWYNEDEGLIYPSDFIPFAEENSLISDLGKIALEQSCELLSRWRDKDIYKDLKISINASAVEFLETNFYENIISTIKKYNIDPTKLVIEVTESLLVSEDNRVIDTMSKLTKDGIKIALDDFGTGYSSLIYLKKFPISIIKIDKKFVDDIVKNHTDRSLVKAIFSVAKDFNLDVVVEGVETIEQEELLKEINPSNFYIQGYLYSKPLPIEEFEEFVTNHIK